jgi:hypothetical protein
MNLTTLKRILLLLTVIVTTGCASAYRSYSGCCVNCRYCAPPPLAYTPYDGCACHSAAASNYLSVLPQHVEPTTDGGKNDERDE